MKMMQMFQKKNISITLRTVVSDDYFYPDDTTKSSIYRIFEEYFDNNDQGENERTSMKDKDESESSTQEDEKNFNDLNYWNNDPSSLGVGDEVLDELD